MEWSKTIRNVLLGIVVFFAFVAKGIDTPSKIRSICLNNLDSIVRIKWSPPEDNCNSFVSYEIYGREDALSVFNLLFTETNYLAGESSFKLPNLKTWEFYISFNYACDGISSLYSDTVFIDKQEPQEWFIDSVSVDLLSQKTLIGWSEHPVADKMGYTVFRVGTNNQLIKDTFGLGLKDVEFGNPRIQSETYSLSAYDSCGNASPLSTNHKTIFLSTFYDTCRQNITLDWTAYEPLKVKEYRLFVSEDSLNNYTLFETVINRNHVFSIPERNKNFCFFVQMFSDTLGGISSSSNRKCVFVEEQVSAENNIHRISVTEEQGIEIIYSSNLQEGTIQLEQSINNGLFFLIESKEASAFLGTETYTLSSDMVDVNNNVYSYRITHLDNCDNPIPTDTSSISNSIVLTFTENIDNINLQWNSYSQFLNNTNRYEILKTYTNNNLLRSTWNILDFVNNSTNSFDVLFTEEDYLNSVCCCIRAIENESLGVRTDTSYSNTICLERPLDVYFPNAIHINGFNTTFYAVGNGIDYKESKIEIYNKWGEKIYTISDVGEGWDGKVNGEYCMEGTYIYIANIRGRKGEQRDYRGIIHILK
jgi:gliding motility-associated-like protein